MNKSRARIAPVIIAALVFLTIFLLLIYAGYVADALTTESTMHLREVATQGAALVTKQSVGDMSILTLLSEGAVSQPTIPVERKLDILKNQADKHSFFRIGYVDARGNAFTTDDHTFSAGNEDFFKASMRGEKYIHAPIKELDRPEIETVIFSVPILYEGQLQGVLFGSYRLEALMDSINISFYGEKGSVQVINSKGDSIMYPKGEKRGDNIFDTAAPHNRAEIMQDFKDGLKSGSAGVVQLELGGKSHFVSYAPTGINDWFVLLSIEADMVFGRSASVIKGTLYFTFCISLLFGVVLIYIFITLKKSNSEISTLAYYDTLTGAPNVEKFRQDARSLIHRHGASKYLLLYIDTRHFRYLNKDFGYEAGDEYLIHTASVLKETVTTGETFARVSGDMFVLLYRRRGSDDFGVEYWSQLRDRIMNYPLVADSRYSIKLNCGICELCRDITNIQTAIDRANIARKSLKDRYDVDIMLYDSDMQRLIDREKEVEQCMHAALENDEFTPYMQPKYCLADGRVVGAEALVRWIKPDGKIILPDEFISLFEKNGFIAELDLYILEMVCSHMREQIDSGTVPVPTSINQSRCYMYGADYVETICTIIEKYKIPPRLIEFEITENIAYKSMDKLIAVVAKLNENGFMISLDDFGSGYSSLNVLKDLKVDVLKLDRVFLGQTIDTERGQTVVANIIRMAKELSIHVVAEGVETLEQVAFLKSASCDMAQGYYFSRPIPMKEFEKLLERQKETVEA